MATNPSEVEMQTQAELYFRYGETDFLFTEKFSYYESIEVFEDNSAVIVDWENEPTPVIVIDRMNNHFVDLLYPDEIL